MPTSFTDGELLSRAKELVASGTLRCEPAATFAAYSAGATCALCGHPIKRGDIECRAQFGTREPSVFWLYFHGPCEEAWRVACREPGLTIVPETDSSLSK